MSRYSFEHNDQRWHVGWDPGLASYYAQAEPLHPTIDLRDVDLRDADVREDDLRDVVPGDRPGEVPTLAALTAQLRGQVVIPDPIREQLADAVPAHPDRHAAAAAHRVYTVMQAAFPHSATAIRAPTAGPSTTDQTVNRPRPTHRDQGPER